MQHVMALELPSVSLGHGQGVFSSLKDFSLVNRTQTAPAEVSLPDDGDPRSPFPLLSQPGGYSWHDPLVELINIDQICSFWIWK